MPTLNVSLTEELDRFILSRVETGRYENASEVVRAGLRALEMDEQEHEEKMAWLRQAIAEGDASGAGGCSYRHTRLGSTATADPSRWSGCHLPGIRHFRAPLFKRKKWGTLVIW
jgi:antitoxin ParD1/3/4